MKRFVLGDIHGEYEYLKDVLQKSGFDYENDLLIQMGDIVDRGPEPFKCMDELLKIKHLVILLGNHDMTFKHYINGGANILSSYPSNGVQVTEQKWNELSKAQKDMYEAKIFNKMTKYFVTPDHILFVHGGFDPKVPIEKQTESYIVWDRELVNDAYDEFVKPTDKKLTGPFKRVFIGHTPTLYYSLIHPFTGGGVTNVDTGSGKGGCLTIMDIDSGKFWQSEYSQELKKLIYGNVTTEEEDTGFSEEEKAGSQGETKLAA